MTIEKSKIKFGLKQLEAIAGPLTFSDMLIIYRGRSKKKMSQAALAKRLGLSPANICDLEKGRKIPSPARAQQIAKKLNEPAQFWVEIAIQDMLRSQKLNYIVKLEAVKKAA
jgi:transcriptional regulator with XRE-family HTH domain